jgi:hypothetical protein
MNSNLKNKKKDNYFPIQYVTNPIFIDVASFGQQIEHKN